MKACKYRCSVIEGSQFEQELKKEGKSAQPITEEEVNILCDKQLLGILNAEALQNTMLFMNTKHSGLRGCDEQHRRNWGDVHLLTDVKGAEYLEYSETDKNENWSRTSESQELTLKFTVSQTIHRTAIQCLLTKFTLRKDLAR